MKILENIEVPTGNILIGDGEHGKLEFLSIGDYGKEKNLKADFLGLPDEINGVPHGDLLPLEKKWVITISSQYGCPMKCRFCDAWKVGAGGNATFNDLVNQVKIARSIHREVEYTERLNLHYARMGEPTLNPEVITSAYYLAGWAREQGWGFHPVVSTMMPKLEHGRNRLLHFLTDWMLLKDRLDGDAGLQISINTTDETARDYQFQGWSHNLKDIADIMDDVLDSQPVVGRKVTLNFALTEDEISGEYLAELFSPDDFLCKITPMHMTNSCKRNNIETSEGYSRYHPYKEVEDNLKDSGFDVIVFVPSIEEDESKITCGNAILSEEYV